MFNDGGGHYLRVIATGSKSWMFRWRSAGEVETSHVLRVLEPIWTTKTETATRVRQRIESVLDWAKVQGYREGENPARWRGHLDKTLPKPSTVR